VDCNPNTGQPGCRCNSNINFGGGQRGCKLNGQVIARDAFISCIPQKITCGAIQSL
jgi:hypothetical protein